MLTVFSVLLDDFLCGDFQILIFNQQMGCGFWHTFSSLFWRISLGVPRLRSALMLCAFVCLWTQQVFRVLVRRYGEFTKLLVTWAKCCNAFAPDAVFCSFIVSPGHLTELRDKENVLLVHLRVYWNFKNLNVDNIINNYSSSPNGLMRARGIIVLVKSN